MQMNRLEHDLKAEAVLEVCLRCEGCSEPSWTKDPVRQARLEIERRWNRRCEHE